MTPTATEQRDAARAKSHRHRQAFAKLRAEVNGIPTDQGAALLASLLEAPEVPRELGHVPIDRYVTSIRRLGPTGAKLIFNTATINTPRRHARLRDLTSGERERIAGALRDAYCSG